MANTSMIDVIRNGAVATVAAAPALCGCPDCGVAPSIDHAFHGQVCVYCDNDDCPQTSGDGWPQTMGATLAEAAAKWNGLGAE